VNETSDDRRRSRRSSRIATCRSSTCGAPRSSSLQRTAAARPRSCTGRASGTGGVDLAGARFMAEGDLWADARQDAQARKPPLPAPTVERVLDVAPGPPPGEATHWTGRMLAKAAGVSLHSVQRILEAHHDPGPLHSGLSWCCDRYSANVGASSRRPIVATLNRRAPMAHSATAITIGRAVPSKTTLKLTMMMPQSSR
jgi:hypothetical protein